MLSAAIASQPQRFYGNSVLAQVAGSRGCDLSLQSCGVYPHAPYSSKASAEEGRRADLQV